MLLYYYDDFANATLADSDFTLAYAMVELAASFSPISLMVNLELDSGIE